VSKRINVNPDHYKVAGRERPGDLVAGRAPKAHAREDEKERERWERKQKKARRKR